MATKYATYDEAHQREVVEVLDAGGGPTTSADYDTWAIADEVIGPVGGGVEHGFALIADDDAFWAAVFRHAYVTEEQRAINLGDMGPKVDAFLSDPAVVQATRGPVRLAWEGPAVGETHRVGAEGAEKAVWTVTVEVPDPDDPDTWVPLDTLIQLPAGEFPGYWEDVTTESFSEAHHDPTSAVPWAATETALLSRLRLDREDLAATHYPW